MGIVLHPRESHASAGAGAGATMCLKETVMKLFKSLFALVAVVAFAAAVPACNTMEGAGKDIKKGGEKMEDAAK